MPLDPCRSLKNIVAPRATIFFLYPQRPRVQPGASSFADPPDHPSPPRRTNHQAAAPDTPPPASTLPRSSSPLPDHPHPTRSSSPYPPGEPPARRFFAKPFFSSLPHTWGKANRRLSTRTMTDGEKTTRTAG